MNFQCLESSMTYMGFENANETGQAHYRWFFDSQAKRYYFNCVEDAAADLRLAKTKQLFLNSSRLPELDEQSYREFVNS